MVERGWCRYVTKLGDNDGMQRRPKDVNKCVFCGAPGPLTKEDVVSKWIAKLFRENFETKSLSLHKNDEHSGRAGTITFKEIRFRERHQADSALRSLQHYLDEGYRGRRHRGFESDDPRATLGLESRLLSARRDVGNAKGALLRSHHGDATLYN